MVSLDEAKTQINMDIAYEDDDNYIALLIDVCVKAVENAINDTALGDITLILPLKQAILLMVANLYANREPVSYANVVKVPYTFDFLIGFYKNYN